MIFKWSKDEEGSYLVGMNDNNPDYIRVEYLGNLKVKFKKNFHIGWIYISKRNRVFLSREEFINMVKEYLMVLDIEKAYYGE